MGMTLFSFNYHLQCPCILDTLARVFYVDKNTVSLPFYYVDKKKVFFLSR